MIRKIYLLMVVSLMSTTFVSAQRVIDKQNCREGESIEYCHQHTHLAKELNNNEFKKQWDKDQAQLMMLCLL